MNPGTVSVESVLERALFLCGGIDASNFGNLHKIGWSRAGRTDKGVHAVANCVSMKLCVPVGKSAETEFLANLNSFLPSDIRVVALTKTTKHFNAKVFCCNRRYHYLLPTYVLSDITSVNEKLLSVLEKRVAVDGSTDHENSEFPKYLNPEELSTVRLDLTPFRVDASTLSFFREVLTKFRGTQKYHNFTSEKNSSDASASRYIIDVQCSDPMILSTSDVEWVCISIHGQSFVLNQVEFYLLFIIKKILFPCTAVYIFVLIRFEK